MRLLNLTCVIVAFAILGQAKGDATSCTIQLQETTAAGIYSNVDSIISNAFRSLTAFSNQVKYSTPQMTGPPGTIDATTNKAQQALYNLAGFHDDVYVYAGWANNGFVAYLKETADGPLLMSYQSPNAATRNTYNIDAVTGLSVGQPKSPSTYAATLRPWYKDAENQCQPDSNGSYDCSIAVSDLYASVFDGLLCWTAAIGLPNWEGSPKYQYLANQLPYQGVNVPDQTNTPSALAGVVAADIPAPRFDDMLKDVLFLEK